MNCTKPAANSRDAIETLLHSACTLRSAHHRRALGKHRSQPVNQSAAFPSFDQKLVEESMLTIAVQINGKLRGTFPAPAKSTKETASRRGKESGIGP